MSEFFIEDEKLLLEQVAKGNEEAFARLFHAYRDKLYAFIYHLSGSKEIAEDIVQDIFLKIWMQKEKLVDIENFNAFLFRISRNHAINLLRRISKETLIYQETQKQSSTLSTLPDEQFRLKKLQQSISFIVNALPPRQKEVYQLSREKNMRQEEIARQLKISISTVQNHLTFALKTIREKLKDYLV